MALTSALFAGLSGLNAHSAKLDVIGNNVANVNTTAFKSSRMLFESLFSQSLGFGTSPSELRGGVNPKQIGNGVGIAGIQRDFSAAGFTGTGDLRDMAIDGNGFFLVQRAGVNFYTRAGTFRQDSDDNLATATGEKLLGYAVDDQFNILTGQLVPINIPVGKQTIAEATRNIALVGNLNKDGDLPTQGTIIDLMGTETAGFSVVGGGGFITATTLLTSIEDPALPGSGTAAFAAGQSIEFKGTGGATRGGTDLPDATFAITAGTTVQDYMDFIASTIGIQSTGSANPDGNTPGVTVDPVTGIIQIVSNAGSVNDLVIAPGDMELLDAAGASLGAPFVTNKTASADGESIRTTIVGFDSLGSEVAVNITMVLDSTTDAGPLWRYFVDSEDDTCSRIRPHHRHAPVRQQRPARSRQLRNHPDY